VKVAYIVNQYPKVSHSFIRREILAVERYGISVLRIAMRGWDATVVDPADESERNSTRHVLQRGAWVLLRSLLVMFVKSPSRFIRTFLVANRMSLVSDQSIIRHWIYFAEACVVAEWVLDFGATHLHAHFGTNSTDVAMLASSLTGIPYSFTAHGSAEIDRARSIALKDKIEGAAFVAAVCSFGRSQLYRWVGHEHWSKIHVVPCGLDEKFLEPPPQPYNDSASLVCVGRLSIEKGHFLLLDALRLVLDAGYRCELVLAGDGELRGAIEKRIARLQLPDHVRITGWISGEQVREEILRARALVLPSFIEGLPVVIMEAMAMSRPVIATYVGGIPELVLNDETGWLVPAGDVNSLARAMQDSLSASPEALTRMGQQGRARVLQRHDIDNAATRLVRLFGAESELAYSAARKAVGE
jgi:colanic acid/amylovoran biosynthesis glycosyltransferase